MPPNDTSSFLQRKLHRYPGALNYLQLNNKFKKPTDTIHIILDKSKMENLPIIEEEDTDEEKRIKIHRILEYLGIKYNNSQALLKLADLYFVNVLYNFIYLLIYIFIYIFIYKFFN